MSTQHPPPGFTPIPGSRSHGWHRKVGAKWEFWYPDDEHAQAVAEERKKAPAGQHDTALRQSLKGANLDLKGVEYTTLKEALGTSPLTWAENTLRLRGVKPKKLPAVIGDASGERFTVMPNVSAENWKSVQAADPEAFTHTIYARNFESIDSPTMKYRVMSGSEPGTYMVMRKDVSTGIAQTVNDVPLDVLQAMLSRWRYAGKGATKTTPHATEKDALGSVWHGEDRVFVAGPEVAALAPLYERLDLSTAKNRIKALKAAKKAAEAKGDFETAAEIQKEIVALEAYEKAFTALNAGRREAVKAAAKKSPSGTLTLTQVYAAEAEFYASPVGRELLKQLAGKRLDVQTLWMAHQSLFAHGQVIADNTTDLAHLTQQTTGFAKDGPMIRGKDKALYTQDDFGLPDMTIEYKEALAGQFATLYALHKNGASLPVRSELTKTITNGEKIIAGGNAPSDGAVQAAVLRAKAQRDVLDAITLLTKGNVISVHYPDVAYNAEVAAGTEVHGKGYVVPGSAHAEQGNLYKRAQAVLTLLSTRRPPPVELPDTLYRGVRLTSAAIAGLHAGLTMNMNAGASAGRLEFVGGINGPASYADTKPVTYVWKKPVCGLPIEWASIFGGGEAEVVQGGTYAIEKIEHVGGAHFSSQGLSNKYGGGFRAYDSTARIVVTLRALTPQELAGMNVNHSEFVPVLARASNDLQAEIHAADIVAHAATMAGFDGVTMAPPRSPNRAEYPFEGFIAYQDIPIDVENVKGSTRSGVSASGKPWSSEMHAHYGEVRMTDKTSGAKGLDGDMLDVYVGDNSRADIAVVVDQRDPETGKRDEQKVMLGFLTEEEAVQAYKRQYDDPRFYGGHKTLGITDFKEKLAQRSQAGKVMKGAPRGGWATLDDMRAARAAALADAEKHGGDTVGEITTSRLADPPLEAQLRRTLAQFEDQGYKGTDLDAEVTLDMRAGRYKRALDRMKKAMDGKQPPRGFVPDGKVKGVWVKYEGGEAVQYWKAGTLYTPEEFAKNHNGEFSADAKVDTRIEASAVWADIERIAKGGGDKPPPGFSPIPGSKKGGYHKRTGAKYQTWYPHTGVTDVHVHTQGNVDSKKTHGPAGSETTRYTVPSGHSASTTSKYTAQGGASRHKKVDTHEVSKHNSLSSTKHRNLGEAMDHLHDLHADSREPGRGAKAAARASQSRADHASTRMEQLQAKLAAAKSSKGAELFPNEEQRKLVIESIQEMIDETNKGGAADADPIFKGEGDADRVWLEAACRDAARDCVMWGCAGMSADDPDEALARVQADRLVARYLGDDDGKSSRLARCIDTFGADCVYSAVLAAMPAARAQVKRVSDLKTPADTSKMLRGDGAIVGVPEGGLSLLDVFSVNGGGLG